MRWTAVGFTPTQVPPRSSEEYPVFLASAPKIGHMVMTHRDRVLEGLSTDEWRDCTDVAEELGWDSDSASKMLSDVHRADYVQRREITDLSQGSNIQYEYKLR